MNIDDAAEAVLRPAAVWKTCAATDRALLDAIHGVAEFGLLPGVRLAVQAATYDSSGAATADIEIFTPYAAIRSVLRSGRRRPPPADE